MRWALLLFRPFISCRDADTCSSPQVCRVRHYTVDGAPGGFAALPFGNVDQLERMNSFETMSSHLRHLGPVGHLAALQLHACRPFPNPGSFAQSDCTGSLGSLESLGSFNSLASPGADRNPLARQTTMKRPRGEKKPIPDDAKDDKYYERRKRNNQAAKKSRDARKIREDRVAMKANILENENELLRAQLLALRAESRALRLLLERSHSHSSSISSHFQNDRI